MAPAIDVGRLIGTVRMDGILEESAWQSVSPVTGFIQRHPAEGEEPTERTEVRFLADDEALYIGARLYDSEPDRIRAAMARRDVVTDFDYVMIYLDSRHDHRSAFIFVLTPSGAYQDAALGADGSMDPGWDPVWEGAATIDEGGWQGEWRIPFSQLRFQAGEAAEWGVEILRMIPRKQELDMFPFISLGERFGPHRFGHLVGLGELPARRRLELLPYATLRSQHLAEDPGNPFRSAADQEAGVGMDLKYGLTSNLTLDLALNPDFGQVEVDPAVVNLTEFETFYPELRPFFVEGGDLFRFGSEGGSLFYSRRIGGAPKGRVGVPGATHVDTPEETTIAGALKLTGRVGEAWSVGLISALTLQEDGRYLGSDGVRGSVPVEPTSSYLAGRIRRDFSAGNSEVGTLFTAVNRDLSHPALESLLPSQAFVGGLDFSHTWKNREWFLDGSVAGSHVAGSPDAILRTQMASARYWQRPDAGHVSVDPSRRSIRGWQGRISAGRSSGDHWTGSVGLFALSPGFEANDLGYAPRVDRRGANLDLRYMDRVPNRLTQNYRFGLSTSVAQNFDGDLLDLQLMASGIQRWANFWGSSTTLLLSPEHDDDQLTRGGPVARAPGRVSIHQSVSTDQRRSQSLAVDLSYSNDSRGGWWMVYGLDVETRPSPALELSIGPSFRRAHVPAQFVGEVEDELATPTYGNRYVFGELDQRTLSLDTRVSWAFSPRLTLQLFLQPLVASGDYSRFMELRQPRKWSWTVYGEDEGTVSDSEDGYAIDPDGEGPAGGFELRNPDFNLRSLRGNAVLRWEFRPGSTVYMVWQQRRFDLGEDGRFRLGDDMGGLFGVEPENVFALKVSYWWGR